MRRHHQAPPDPPRPRYDRWSLSTCAMSASLVLAACAQNTAQSPSAADEKAKTPALQPAAAPMGPGMQRSDETTPKAMHEPETAPMGPGMQGEQSGTGGSGGMRPRPGMGMRPGPGMGMGMGRRCQDKFETFDSNGDGLITEEEFSASPHRRGEAGMLFRERDVNGDGSLTFDEFCPADD